MFSRHFISPSSDTNSSGAQGVQGSQVMARFDQPIVFQRIGQQKYRPGASRCHGRVEEAGPSPLCRTARHVRGAFLVGSQMHQCFAFHPQMASVLYRCGTVGHDHTSQRSLMTAPMLQILNSERIRRLQSRERPYVRGLEHGQPRRRLPSAGSTTPECVRHGQHPQQGPSPSPC